MIKNIFKNEYVFSVFTKILMIIIAFFHSILIARFLGAELKGVHATIYSIVAIGTVIINVSSQQAYPYFRKKYGYDIYFNKYMSFTILYHLVITVILGSVAFFVLKVNYIIAFSILLIPINSFAMVLGYISLVEYPRTRNKALLVIDILDTCLILIMSLMGKPSIWLIFIILVFPLILKIIYFKHINIFKFTKECMDKSFIIELFKFCFYPMVSMLLTMLNYKIDILMLKMNNHIELTQIGIYSIGVSLADKVVYIPDAVKEILLSKLSKGSGKEEVALTMRFCFPISILIGIIILILGENVINLLYGNEYNGAYIITVICVFGTAMMVFFKMISQYNNVNGKQNVNVYLLFFSIIINVVLNYIMIPKYGILGTGIASLISYTVCAIMFLFYFKSVSGISIKNLIFINKSDIIKIKNVLKKKEGC